MLLVLLLLSFIKHRSKFCMLRYFVVLNFLSLIYKSKIPRYNFELNSFTSFPPGVEESPFRFSKLESCWGWKSMTGFAWPWTKSLSSSSSQPFGVELFQSSLLSRPFCWSKITPELFCAASSVFSITPELFCAVSSVFISCSKHFSLMLDT